MIKFRHVLFMIIVMFIGIMYIEYVHEHTHKVIAYYFGYDAVVHMDFLRGSETVITIPKETGQDEKHELLQDMTDIVGYQMVSTYFLFSLTTILCMMIIMHDKN